MLEYLALTCLLALCAGHYFLIRGCMHIKMEASSLGSIIDAKMAETNNLLNEVAELLDEMVGASPAPTVDAHTGNPLQALLSGWLNNKMSMTDVHASTEAERTIRTEVIDSSTTLSQDDQHLKHRSEPLGDERYHEGIL